MAELRTRSYKATFVVITSSGTDDLSADLVRRGHPLGRRSHVRPARLRGRVPDRRRAKCDHRNGDVLGRGSATRGGPRVWIAAPTVLRGIGVSSSTNTRIES